MVAPRGGINDWKEVQEASGAHGVLPVDLFAAGYVSVFNLWELRSK